MQSIVESAPVKRRGNPYRDADGKFCRQSEAVYIVDSEGRLKKYSRANPYHDKLGKFAKGGHGGYSPGKWEKHAGNQAMVADIEASFLKEVPAAQQKINVEKDGPDWAHKKATFMASMMGADTTVKYKNGEHSISFTGSASEEHQKRFLGEFDTMASKFPPGKPMHVSVDAEKTFEAPDIGGETIPGKGYIRVNETALTSKTWPGMPASKNVTSSQYVLAHEWGHAIASEDIQKNKEVHQSAIKAGGLTSYGIRGADGVLAPMEGFAESFAEWSLTDGKTDNAAAQEYAKANKWGEKFDSH